MKERIRELLQETDISIKQVAQKAGVSIRTLHNWLNGETGMTVYNIENVLDVLGYKLEVRKL